MSARLGLLLQKERSAFETVGSGQVTLLSTGAVGAIVDGGQAV
jgi:hypothetical protein